MGELDFLIIDSPPGTGDEPLSVCQLIGTVDGAVIVTHAAEGGGVDVRKQRSPSAVLINVPVIGVVENMSGFACPKCGEVTQIFRSGGGRDRRGHECAVPWSDPHRLRNRGGVRRGKGVRRAPCGHADGAGHAGVSSNGSEAL